MAGRRTAVALALLTAAAAALPSAGAGGAARPAPRVGAPFTLATGFQAGYGSGPVALGPDGTVWLAQPGFGANPSTSFAIVARAAGGRTLRPAVTADDPGSSADRPVIAAAAGRATFVWQTATNTGGSSGTASVRARSCTLAGCAPVQVLERWGWSTRGPPGGSGFSAVGDAEPAVAVIGARVLALFYRDGGDRRMEWAVAGGDGRFGPPRPLAGPGGPDPVLAAGSGGGVVAAWITGDLAAFGTGVGWAPWSGSALSRARPLASTVGSTFSDLVAAPAGRGAALAWVAGTNVSDPTPSEPIWTARRGGTGGFTRPRRVFGGDAFGLALAGGASDTLALAFSATRGPGANSLDPGPAWVKRSAGGRPFGPAVDLDATAAAPASVAVSGRGDVVAAWNACAGATCAAQLAVASRTGSFGRAVAAGPANRLDAPVVQASGGRILVSWQIGDAVEGAFVTP